MRSFRAAKLSGLLLAALVASSCSDPETKKVQHVQRGDQYAAEKRDEFAVVEYASAVKLDPKFGEARFKLAQTYERMSNLRAAFPEYIRAADALPDNREAQIKATGCCCWPGGSRTPRRARRRCSRRTRKMSRRSSCTPMRWRRCDDPAGALAQIEEALKVNPESSQAFMNLGVVRMQSGQAKEAEAAFRRAVAWIRPPLEARLGARELSVDGRTRAGSGGRHQGGACQ